MIGFLGHCWGIDSVLIEASSVEISQITPAFPTVEEGALGSISGAPQPEARFGKRVGVVLEINKNMYMSTCNDTFGIQHTGRIRYNITVAQQSITIITSGWESEICFSTWPYWGHQQKIGWLKRSYLDFWAKLFLYVCNRQLARQLAGISFGWIELVYYWMTQPMANL